MPKALDITGQVFGRLRVAALAASGRRRKWRCVCTCGSQTLVETYLLRNGHTQSCGCLSSEKTAERNRSGASNVPVGTVFNRLTIVKRIGSVKGHIKYLCRCLCGKFTTSNKADLERGYKKSCGCWNSEVVTRRNFVHGLSKTKPYKNSFASKRRADQINRTPSWADLKAIRSFYMNCPEGYEVDHIVPLRGKMVSGLHVLGNLQYLPADENRRKRNLFTPSITKVTGS